MKVIFSALTVSVAFAELCLRVHAANAVTPLEHHFPKVVLCWVNVRHPVRCESLSFLSYPVSIILFMVDGVEGYGNNTFEEVYSSVLPTKDDQQRRKFWIQVRQ
jgi:hypothetical protein